MKVTVSPTEAFKVSGKVFTLHTRRIPFSLPHAFPTAASYWTRPLRLYLISCTKLTEHDPDHVMVDDDVIVKALRRPFLRIT